MKIVVIGADGQLGSDLLPVLGKYSLVPLYYPEFDVTRHKKMGEILKAIRPDVVINTAAFHRVDECEDDPEQSFLVNAVAVRELSFICRDTDAVLVHFSTDYVFDGEKRTPYVEDDVPNPLNVYAASKLAGEYFVKNIMKKYFLIRTCGLYGKAGCKEKGTNFVDKIYKMASESREIRVVDDQYVTPTSTSELAGVIAELIETNKYGLYHLTNEGECSWYEFAGSILEIRGLRTSINPVKTKEYPVKARRPFYSVLENKNAKSVGLKGFSFWKDALKKYLGQKYGPPGLPSKEKKVSGKTFSR
ncbi:MAG: dTDP-4-dehydrorhamnose reductase [Candidatus Aminicenantes bacterium]|nr:dTDP-4-dehydrorhamnose reductase [Candidatus Aminicenantes bacterium]